MLAASYHTTVQWLIRNRGGGFDIHFNGSAVSADSSCKLELWEEFIDSSSDEAVDYKYYQLMASESVKQCSTHVQNNTG